MVTLKDIVVGDEITFNYNDSEIDMANPFTVNGEMVNGNKMNN